jgi:hypothetical protein
MKNQNKSHVKRGFGSTTDIVGVSLCLVWVLLSDNKVVNAMFGSEKPKVESKTKLDLPDITIPDLGQKYLRSCR